MRIRIIAFLSLMATSFGGVAIIVPVEQSWGQSEPLQRFDDSLPILFGEPVVTPPVTDCSYCWRF